MAVAKVKGWLSATIPIPLVGALAKGNSNLPIKLFCIDLLNEPTKPSRFSVNNILFPASSTSALTASGSNKIFKAASLASISVPPFILTILAAFIACSCIAPLWTIIRQKSSPDWRAAPGMRMALPK